ncbi:MAG: hypothetical protein AAGA34_05955 [Pseudomonadota bacterium]
MARQHGERSATRRDAVTATYDGYGRLATYDRTNIGAQTYTYNGLGDRVRVDKPTGTRHFVYDAWGRVVAGSEAERARRGQYGASASDVKAEFIWALRSLLAPAGLNAPRRS